MSVGLRRFRAAISLFSKILDQRDIGKIKGELKWLTNELAPAREIDVFIKERVSDTLDLAPRRGVSAIRSQFANKRAQALARAKEAIASPRFRSLLVELLAWIAPYTLSSNACWVDA
jgi:CHAD domain-containing protein